MNMLLEKVNVNKSWEKFIENDVVLNELNSIDNEIKDTEFTPEVENILRFLTVNLNNINVVVIGKDTYPQLRETEGGRKCVATGRSFEVGGIKSWSDKKVNASLKNILKLLHKTYFKLNKPKSIEEIRKDIEEGNFPIKEPNEVFDYWEKEGVLFINAALTCERGNINNAGSHLKLWKKFFEELLKYIAKNNDNMNYFLWGWSKKYKKLLIKNNVDIKNIYCSNHPSSIGKEDNGFKRECEFMKNPCFKETDNIIKWI